MHTCTKQCETRISLELLKQAALFKANKYRFDPTIGKIHNQYLEAIDAIITSIKMERNDA